MRLTTCKSAARDRLTAHTNLRFRCWASRSAAPTRSAGPIQPVGCICVLGTSRARETAPSSVPGTPLPVRLPGPSGGSVRRTRRCRSWAAGTERPPRRGRMLRPPHRSVILPSSGRRHSARTSGGPRRHGAGAANSTQGPRSRTTVMAAASRRRAPLRHTTTGLPWIGWCLTTCASAAGDHPTARTNLRFRCLASWRVTPGRSAGPPRPVGCMRGLGSHLRRCQF